MTAEKPSYELVVPGFWTRWESHTTQADPIQVVELILTMPFDSVRVTNLPKAAILMTVIEAAVADQDWALIAHQYGADKWYVFELQPRGAAPERRRD